MADRQAFDAYVRERWDPLLRTAALLTGDAAAAEDLLQESLVRAARHWHRVDPGAVDSYVRRIRVKLDRVGSPVRLETVRGVGFRLT